MGPESVEQERHSLYQSVCCLYRRLESMWTWEHGAEGLENQAIYGAMKTTPSDNRGDIQGESRLRKSPSLNLFHQLRVQLYICYQWSLAMI